MHILKSIAKQAVLVDYNQIPLLKLASGKNIDKIKIPFGFNKVEVNQDANSGDIVAIVLRFGTFKTNEGNDVVINRLVLEERKFVIEIEGSSNFVRELYEQVKRLLADFVDSQDADYLNPILFADESELVLKLDFQVNRLINPEFLEFVQARVTKEASYDIADTFLRVAAVSFLLDYKITDETLYEQRIGLSRKEFSVQPAIGYPVDEQVYYSKAPFDTKTHEDILGDLEKLLSK